MTGVNPLHARVAERVAQIFALTDGRSAHEALVTEYELELRFGRKRAERFDATVPAYLALGLFDYLCNGGERVALCATDESVVERSSAADDGMRVVHNATHTECTMMEKTAVMRHSDLVTQRSIEADVRVSLARETRRGRLAACDRSMRGPTVRRKRRSLRFVESRRGADDFWRLDVTRLDNGVAYQLELELEFDRALRTLAAERADLTGDAFRAYAVDAIADRLCAVVARLESGMERVAARYDAAVDRLQSAIRAR